MNTDYKISTTGEMRLRSIDKMPSLLPLNRQTEKLVILNYPFEGGGKFIGLVLALHPKFVHQERVLASLKMKYNYDQLWSFKYSSDVLSQHKPEVDQHFEFGCVGLAGFMNYEDQIERDDELANDVFRVLCHNDTHYFPMVNQRQENSYYKYVNAKHLMYQNCDWILEGRQHDSYKREKYYYDARPDRKNTHDFDMESITSFTHFYDEIHKTLLWLGLDDLEEE